eukprot:756813-Hanusia_phi.AAC.4
MQVIEASKTEAERRLIFEVDPNSAPCGRSDRCVQLPKTMERLREDVLEWSLADDVGLLKVIEDISSDIRSQIRSVEKDVDDLMYETSRAHVALCNTFTDFSMLSHRQVSSPCPALCSSHTSC